MKKRWKVIYVFENSAIYHKRLCTTKLGAYYLALWLLREEFNVRIEKNNYK